MAKRNPLFPSSSGRAPLWTEHLMLGLTSGLVLAVVVSLVYNETKWYVPLILMILSFAMCTYGLTRRILSLVTLLIGSCLGLSIFTPVLQPIEQFFDVTELPSKADVIVILGGGMHCGSTDMEASSLARTIKGLELWKAGYAPTITISDTTGLWENCVSLEQPSRLEISQLEPRNPPEIVVLASVKNTRMEAEAVAKEAKKRAWKTVLVVTSPSHSKRARATFMQLKLQTFVVSAGEPRYDTELHLPHDRLKAIPALAREIAGFVKYTLLGWF